MNVAMEHNRREDDDIITRKVNLVVRSIKDVGFPIVSNLILLGLLGYILLVMFPRFQESRSADITKMTEALNKNTEGYQSLKRFLTKRYD